MEHVHDVFLDQEGRRERRVLFVPRPKYREEYEELQEFVKEVIDTKHRPTWLAALSSMEVDLAYAQYACDEFDENSDFRILRRTLEQFERLAAGFGKFEGAETKLYRSIIEPVRLPAETINSELIRYISKHPQALQQLRPRQFEELIAEILAHFGWDIELTPQTKDGGFDILGISKSNAAGVRTSYIIECKRYIPPRLVGVEVVRQLLHVKQELTVSHAMLVTSSDFTRGVYDFQANRLDFDAKNFDAIRQWCKSYTSYETG
jgi:hypothetical protein